MISGIGKMDLYDQALKTGIPALPPEMVTGHSENTIREETEREMDENKRKVDNICKGDFLNHKNLR